MVKLLVEQGQGSCLLIVEAFQEGQARRKFVVQTIELVSEKTRSGRRSTVPCPHCCLGFHLRAQHSEAGQGRLLDCLSSLAVADNLDCCS